MHLYVFPKEKSAEGNGFIKLQKGQYISLKFFLQYPHLITCPVIGIFLLK
jgi:hypothetical protein